jgi:SSS family solute:Na+ symporter
MTFTGWTLLSHRGLLPDMLSAPFDLYYTGLIGNILMFVIGYLGALALPRRTPLTFDNGVQ